MQFHPQQAMYFLYFFILQYLSGLKNIAMSIFLQYRLTLCLLCQLVLLTDRQTPLPYSDGK